MTPSGTVAPWKEQSQLLALLGVEVTLLSLSLVVLTYLLLQLERTKYSPDYNWKPYVDLLRLSRVGLYLGEVAVIVLLICLHVGQPTQVAVLPTLPASTLGTIRLVLYTISVGLFAAQLLTIVYGMLKSIHRALREIPSKTDIQKIVRAKKHDAKKTR